MSTNVTSLREMAPRRRALSSMRGEIFLEMRRLLVSSPATRGIKDMSLLTELDGLRLGRAIKMSPLPGLRDRHGQGCPVAGLIES